MPLKASNLAVSLQCRAGRLFSKIPLSANKITALAVAFALAGFLLSLAGMHPLSVAFFALAGLSDAIDGAVARERKEASPLGAYLDGIADRIVEFLLISSLFLYQLPSLILPSFAWLVLALFFGTCMTSFATAYADHRKVAGFQKISRQPGILPRAERFALLFTALLLAPACPLCASLAIFACAALSIATFAQRLAFFIS